jgi:hypothetical protein
MGSKKKTNPDKAKAQKFRTAVNKRKAWEKHLEKFPNDAQGKAKLAELMKS